MRLNLPNLLKLASVAAISAYAGSALAFFDADIMVGKRWYDVGSIPKAGISAQELSLAAHLDPIPLVPVSFGVRLDTDMLNKSDVHFASVDTATVVRPGIDIMAWVPLFPMFTPYARLTVPVLGTFTTKGKDSGHDVDVSGPITGYDLDIGARFHLIPLVRLLVEYDHGIEKAKLDVKVDGIKNSTETDNLTSNAFLVGVEVGI